MFRARGARSVRAASVLLLTLAASLCLPAAASAVGLSVPHDVLGKVTVRGSLTATEPAGTALLLVDGAVVRSAPATAAAVRSLTFPDVPLAVGAHEVKVLVRSAKGFASSRAAEVVSWARPVPAILVSPSAYCNKTAPVVVKAGPATTKVTVYLNGRWAGAKDVVPGQVVTVCTASMSAGTNTLVVEASNPAGKTSGTFKVKRLDIPWATCIIVDKSEYRLYWVRDWDVVKTYPVAIGKSSTPTPSRNWRVGAKYVYEHWGVYGPRRLRLYKQVGGSFEYTGYGIHGTNEEWVIGTKASHGCIRMYNKDVLELYPQVPLYTMVQTRD